MEGNKQRTGLFGKAAAMISSLSNEISLLTTDAIPDKSYTERKSQSLQNRNKIISDVKKSQNNASIVSSNTENHNSDEDNMVNEDTPKKNSFFGTNSNNNKKEKKNRSKDKGNVVYNITKCSDVHIGQKITLERNIQISAQNAKKQKATVAITPEIKDAFANTTVLAVEHIMEVQSHIGDNWRELGRRLGLNDGQLDQIKADFSPQRERVYQMLLDWMRTETNEPTVGILCHHLWTVDEKYAVKMLASYLSRSFTK